ncbi:MAG: YigZ family protein [Eubacteriales bacterium]
MQDSQGLKQYHTIASPGESEVVINKSRFLGFCLPVASEAQAQELLAGIRKRHYDARHCCYAFRLAEGGIVRSSDDGEPSGTAGAPILSVLTGAGVENTLCAVVRYFGGVLLGTGGLVRAYGRAASEALTAATRAHMRICTRLKIDVSYAAYNALEPLLRTKGYPCETVFEEHVSISVLLPAEEAEAFSHELTQRTDGRAEIETLGASLEAFPA